MLKALLGLDTDELRRLAQEEGGPSYRGNQLAEWLYQRGAQTLEEMTNLPGELIERLGKQYEVGLPEIVASLHSRDGTVKLLLAMRDGSKVETVGIPYTARFGCCISTQVGCSIGCIFCATGMSGYTRNLSAGEIIGQVLAVASATRDSLDNTGRRIDHVTFMGMGEPLFNYDATLKVLNLLNREMGISARNLTVSTSGFVPGILKLAQEKLQITLAVSLHAPGDDLRHYLVPGVSRWGISEIIEACREYIKMTGRRVTFEYCLLDSVNDGDSEAKELIRVLRGLNCHVNLIPYNPVSGLTFRASPPKRIKAFREMLAASCIQVTQRLQRGADIDAACGQLRRRSTLTASKT